MKVIIDLNIPEQELMKYYRDGITTVVARDIQGKVIRFPAGILRQFVTSSGVNGTFVIEYNQQGKLINIKNMSL